MVSVLKSAARTLVAQPLVGRQFWRLVRGRQLIVMMHRFAMPGAEHRGHDPQAFRELLSYLRRCQVELISVDELVSRALTDTADVAARRAPAVAFTVDDGYRDVADLAQPIFAEFDCPFTVYVVPEVVDGQRVFWWDQLTWMRRHGRRTSWTVALPNGALEFHWHDEPSAFAAQKALEEHLKLLTPEQLQTVLEDLSRQSDTPLLHSPSDEDRVLGWDALRALERGGASVGAHSMTHPILSRCDNARAEWEVATSVSRVHKEMASASKVFCYPNGRLMDFTDREAGTLQAAGMLGGLSSVPGLIPVPGDSDTQWRWRVPRMSYDSRPGTLLRAFFD